MFKKEEEEEVGQIRKRFSSSLRPGKIRQKIESHEESPSFKDAASFEEETRARSADK